MAWFKPNEGKKTLGSLYDDIPMPELTNCEQNYYELNNWQLYCLHNRPYAGRTVRWDKLERGYYQAFLDDGSVIFCVLKSNGSVSSRFCSAEEAKFGTQVEWMREFARRLYFLLDNRNVTQLQLSERTGISQSSLSCYLSKTRLPSSYVLRQLANALHTSTDFLSNF